MLRSCLNSGAQVTQRWTTHEQNNNARNAMATLIQICPSRAHKQVASMKSSISALSLLVIKESGCWHAIYTTNTLLPQYVCAIILVPRVKVDKNIVDSIELKEP